MIRNTLAVTTSGLLLLSSGGILAHHSAVRFNTDAAVTIRGTLSRAEIASPHSMLFVEQETPDGTITWAIEGPAPNALFRRGLNGDNFPEGAVFEACGYVLRDDSEYQRPDARVILAEVLVMPDGSARLWSPYGNERCREQGVYTIVAE